MTRLHIGAVWPADSSIDASQVGELIARHAPGGADEPRTGTGPGWQWLGQRLDVAGQTAPDVVDHSRSPWWPRLRAEAAHAGVDVALTTGELAEHGPALVVCDVDATFMQGEAIDHLAQLAGAGTEVARVTAAAMHGEIDFAESLRRRVQHLRGLPAGEVTRVASGSRLMPGADELSRELRARGVPLALASGGFVEVIAPHAGPLGIERVRANVLEVEAGRLTGRLAAAVVGPAEKAAAVLAWAAELGVDARGVVAVGDGANDLEMLAAAGLGVAFCAKPVVRERATASVSFPRLDAVLGLLPMP